MKVATLFLCSVTLCAIIQKTVETTFSNELADGWVAVFADYNAKSKKEGFYGEIRKSDKKDSQETGFFLSSMNRADDVFMGVTRKIPLNTKASNLSIIYTVKMATNVSGGCIGQGGSPTDSVFFKVGAVQMKPQVEFESPDFWHLVNVDKGNQATSGKNMTVIGTLKNPNLPDDCVGNVEYKQMTLTGKFRAEASNVYSDEIWLIIGTGYSKFNVVDSGFEGRTSYYIHSIKAELNYFGNSTTSTASNAAMHYFYPFVGFLFV